MFERFNAGARQAVVYSQEEARRFNCDYIGTEHLLLGLLRERNGLAGEALRNLGVTEARARAEAKGVVIASTKAPREGQLPFTPRLKQVLDLGSREALSLGHNYIGTEHLLLGFVRGDQGSGAEILRTLGVDVEMVRLEIIRLLSGPQGKSRRSSRSVSDPAERASSSAWSELSEQTRIPWPGVRSTAAEKASSGEREQPAPALGEPDDPSAELEAVPTHSDRPAAADELGRERLADVLGERIRRVRGEDTERPVGSRSDRRAKLRGDRAKACGTGSFMVHIHAPWGAGKSSLLNFLAKDLRNLGEPGRGLRRRRAEDPHLSQWIVAEFGAWEHQRLDPPWWWLLATIGRSCRGELWRIDRGRWAWFVIRDVGWRVWNSRAAWISVLLAVGLAILAATLNWFGSSGGSLTALKTTALSVSALLAFGALVWGQIWGTSRWLAFGSSGGAVRFMRRAQDPLGVYRNRFRWLVRSAGRPIAVFIDDLDRCKPRYAVELLEGIQTLFAREPVTYVVAADRRWLCECFATEYEDLRDAVDTPGRPLGFLFLEKTFQISMEIPPMSFEDRRRYWDRLMSGANGAEGSSVDVVDVDLVDAFASVRTQQDVERRIDTLLERGASEEAVLRAAVRKLNAPRLQAQLEGLLGEFAPLLENNPRAMKRLVNAYGFERDRLVRERRLPTLEERKKLILFTILRLRWPVFADHLLKRPEDVELIDGGTRGLPGDHPFAQLLEDREVRLLFDGSMVDEKLEPDLFRRYSGREPEQPPSVGA